MIDKIHAEVLDGNLWIFLMRHWEGAFWTSFIIFSSICCLKREFEAEIPATARTHSGDSGAVRWKGLGRPYCEEEPPHSRDYLPSNWHLAGKCISVSLKAFLFWLSDTHLILNDRVYPNKILFLLQKAPKESLSGWNFGKLERGPLFWGSAYCCCRLPHQVWVGFPNSSYFYFFT